MSRPPLDLLAEQTFPTGDGETARLIRDFDWASTPLGPIADWPQSLKTATGMVVNAPVPIVMLWGPEGVMIYNDAYSVFAGGRHPELLGCNVREGWPEVADFNDNVMEVGLAGGTLAYKDQELTLHRHGRPEQVWMDLDYWPVPDESGAPAGVIATVVETTERVQAERIATEERDRQRAMLRQMPGFAAVLAGPEQRIEFVNDAYREISGGRAQVGMTVREVFPELETQGFYELLDQVYATGEPFFAHAIPVDLEDRGRRFLDFVYEPVRDATGAIIGIFVGGYDVTVAKESAGELALSEARYRALFDNIASGFCIIQMKFDAAMRPVDYMIVEGNAAFEAMTGLTDAQGKWVSEIAPGLERHWFDLYGQVALTGEPVRFENPADIFGRWYDVQALRIGEPDQRRVAILFNNITARKRLEAHQSAFIELDEASAGSDDSTQIIVAASRILGQALGVGRVGYGEVDAQAETITITGDWSAEGVGGLIGLYRYRDYGRHLARLLAGEAVAVADVETDPLTADDPEPLRALGIRSFLDIPLTDQGRLVAQMFVHAPAPRVWAEDEIGFVRDFAHRTRAAVDRARAASALRDRQVHLDALIAQTAAGLAETDLYGRLISVNDRFTQMVRRDRATLLDGMTMQSITHPDDLGRNLSAFQTMITDGTPFEIEKRYLRPDGSEIWVHNHVSAIRGVTGTIESVLAVSIEVTARKQLEMRQAVLLELNDVVRDLTAPADIAHASSRILAEALGVSRVGYGVMDTVAETVTIERDYNAPGVHSLAGVIQFRDFGSYIEDLARGDIVVIDDASQDRRVDDGGEALAGIRATALINLPLIERGEVVALLFVNNATPRAWSDSEIALVREVAERVRTATERARAAVALRESEARFRNMADHTPMIMWVTDPTGYCTYLNRTWYEFTGQTDAEAEGLGWLDATHPDDKDRAAQVFLEANAAQAPFQLEYRLRRADGVYRWAIDAASPRFGADGAYLGYVGSVIDIDARREIEDALRATETELRGLNATLEDRVSERTDELQAAHETLRQSQKMEAVGQLTGGIAHDFNNLLAGISGALELLSKRLAEGRLNGMERYIDAAQGSAQRAASLTQRLLAFSRRQTLDPKPTDVNRLIGGMEDLIRRSVGPDVEVEVVGAGGLWTTRVDPSQLENALLNLCINGRDAMAPDGGRLTIETANKWLDDKPARERDLVPGQYISLCVTDTGTGMTPEVQAQAFDPFFTTKPLGHGTGLGLSMIHGFVRQSGGQVRIYSEVGKGTTMCLYLPRYGGTLEAGGVAEDAPVAEGGHGETVLVIDDEATVRMLVAEVLGEAGYRVIEAPDGPSGLDILRSDQRIDLLVSDVGLPGGMNGRQVADAARESRPDLKVLFITGYAENAAVGNGLLGPGMEVITKPFVMAELALKVHEMIEG